MVMRGGAGGILFITTALMVGTYNIWYKGVVTNQLSLLFSVIDN